MCPGHSPRRLILLLFAFLAMTLATPAYADQPALVPGGLMFVENVGQFPQGACFRVYGAEQPIWLAKDGIWVAQQGTGSQGLYLKLGFESANPQAHLEPFGPLDTTVSYFLGDDPADWRPSVPVWAGVRYRELYPALDLEVTSEGGGWVWRMRGHDRLSDAEMRVALRQVRFSIEGGELAGIADDMLVIETALGALCWPQIQGGVSQVRTGLAAVDVDEASHLRYATYLGGSDDEYLRDMAVDRAGSVYLTGSTLSSGFPTTPGTFDASLAGSEDVFVAKLADDGGSLVYATFVGGAGIDQGEGIAVDSTGHAYISGVTWSSGFPTTDDVYDRHYGTRGDAFCSKLAPDGASLVYSTYLGGGAIDRARAIAVDSLGNAYLTGETASESFPITDGAYESAYDGGENVFVSKLDPFGAELGYSFLVGSPGKERGHGIAVDGAGSAYVIGWTDHVSFTTTPGALGETYAGGLYDVFCLKVEPDGADLVYSRLLGGGGWDEPGDIALDVMGSAYVAGWTDSLDFPVTAGAYQTTWADDDGKNGFLAKLTSDGTDLVYGTYLGGSDVDQAYGVAVDGAGNAYVSGDTRSDDFPTTERVYDSTYNGGETWGGDAFLCKLNPSGSAATYATYLGGSNSDGETRIALDRTGMAYLAGRTMSPDFPATANAYDTGYNGGNWGDVFVTKLAADPSIKLWLPVIIR